MFKQILSICLVVFMSAGAFAQQTAKMSVQVSKKEVAAGESFEVKFVVENSRGGRFVNPDWASAGLTVVGTSQSSSFSFSGGSTVSSSTYNFQVVASDTGIVRIPPAVLKTGSEEIKTDTPVIHVLPGDSKPKTSPRVKEPLTVPDSDPKKKIKTIRM